MLNDKLFLKEFNKNLLNIEQKLKIDDIDENYPNIFLLGLPRSGTTLLSQILFNNLDISCTNNLIAKFWKAPLTGCYLSKLTIGKTKSSSYHSDYGQTKDIYSPHEFSWFWHELLKIKDITVYNPSQADEIIDWNNVRKILLNFNRIYENVFIHKVLELGIYHIKRFNNLFKKSIFIFIERNPKDIAISLANSRIAKYNDLDIWWSSYPLEYTELKSLPYWEQIAGQVYHLSKMYEEKIKLIDKERLIKIRYNDLCINPQKLLDNVKTKIKKLFDYEITQINTPRSFEVSKPKIDKKTEQDLINGLQKFNLL